MNARGHVVGSIPTRGNEIIFSFPCSAKDAKRGVEFRYSTRNAPEFGEKWGTEVF